MKPLAASAFTFTLYEAYVRGLSLMVLSAEELTGCSEIQAPQQSFHLGCDTYRSKHVASVAVSNLHPSPDSLCSLKAD